MYNIKLYDRLPTVNAATVKRERVVAAHLYPVWTPGEAGRGLHEGFLNASLSDKMGFAIMYEMQKPWGGTDENDIINNLMPFWLENYFLRPNYLKIDNKPVLFIYDNSRQFADTFGSAAEQKNCLDKMRGIAKSHGFDGMYIALE